MTFGIKHSAHAALFALALGASSVAVAQTEGAPMQAPAAQVSDSELQKFADAYASTLEIRQEFTQQLNSAESSEEVQELQQRANEEMIQAVEDNGLSLEEYNTIAQAVSSDPELQTRLSSMIAQ